MRIIKCGFSKTFPINQYYEKVWVEAELNEGENERDCLYELKRTVENFFYESSKAAEKQMGAWVNPLPNDYVTVSDIKTENITREQSIINQINECSDLKVLESFALIAKNYPAVNEAYDLKFKQLSQ